MGFRASVLEVFGVEFFKETQQPKGNDAQNDVNTKQHASGFKQRTSVGARFFLLRL